MQNLVNSFKSAALSLGEHLTPVLKESKFKDTGVLTPAEFVAAGDFLVHHCPTWSWAKASDAAGTRDYLPADKQYLLTKRVPCHRRCKDMAYDSNLEKLLDGDDDDAEGWIDTHHNAVEQAEEVVVDADDLFPGSKQAAATDSDDDDDGEAVMDMDAIMSGGGTTSNLLVSKAPETTGTTSKDNILKTRTYDLHITYDKYYQVPRLWLLGYDENQKYLTVEQMNEDFSEDHANKTITIESHPHISNVSMASIHPCRHAEVMKRLIEQVDGKEGRNEITVEKYLLIFLKFVQAVIPTIEYDYTRSIEL
uniref:Ubiquitin-like-conjugating enzyme ATG3 n=1 Tax=Panagrellus redivivus TaxID=6233 RepID=A0A7E4UZB2_PANRE